MECQTLLPGKGGSLYPYRRGRYEKMLAPVKEKKPHLRARSLIVIKITGIFECAPGKRAGEKI
jgi:hypothetical protein